MAEHPDWVLHARRFVALGAKEHLNQAIAACQDTTVRAFLKRPDVAEDRVPPDGFRPLLECLTAAGRSAEAAMIEVLSLRHLALLVDSPEQRDDNQREFTAKVCLHLAVTSQEQGMAECEAVFTHILGTHSCELCEWVEARQLLTHSLGLYHELAARDIYRSAIARTLNNLGNVFDDMKQPELAETSQEAIEAAEGAAGDPSQHFLSKGVASTAYKRWLAYCAAAQEEDKMFRCLASLREGSVRALGQVVREGLEAAQAKLAEAAEDIKRRISVLIVNGAGRRGDVLALLSPTGKVLDFVIDTTFGPTADRLFEEVQQVFDMEGKHSGREREQAVRELGKQAWAVLPDFAKHALKPSPDADVLISEDRYWTAFPWEALCFGSGEDHWLGLHRCLARWGPITAGGLSRLGDGSSPKARRLRRSSLRGTCRSSRTASRWSRCLAAKTKPSR